jgi:hypothetical protein
MGPTLRERQYRCGVLSLWCMNVYSCTEYTPAQQSSTTQQRSLLLIRLASCCGGHGGCRYTAYCTVNRIAGSLGMSPGYKNQGDGSCSVLGAHSRGDLNNRKGDSTQLTRHRITVDTTHGRAVRLSACPGRIGCTLQVMAHPATVKGSKGLPNTCGLAKPYYPSRAN